MKGLLKYLENRKEGCDPSGRAILDQWIASLQILENKAKAYDEVKAERDIAFLQLKELGTTFGEKPELAKERLWEEQRQIQERLSVAGTVFQEKGSNHTYKTYYDEEENEILAMDELGDSYPLTDFTLTRLSFIPSDYTLGGIEIEEPELD